MALIRWEPAPAHSLQSELSRLFGSVFEAPHADNGIQARRFTPPMDLVEENGEYVLHADLPGVREDDVKVELEDNVLTVSGERSSQHEQEKDGYRRIERAYGSFTRSLTVPDGVAADSVQAHFENGVLTVRIPKPEQRKPHKVAISVGAQAPAIEGQASESAPEGN